MQSVVSKEYLIKFWFQNMKELSKNISYERLAYESVDDKNRC